MSSSVQSSTTTTQKGSHWWLLVLPGLVATLITAVTSAVFGVSPTLTSTVPAPIKFVFGAAVLTAPALVAIGIHFDRKYVASVSAWKPRSEYILLGIAMWFGIGIPLALLYLFRRHKYVGVP
ncbi:hypothetical protein SAMN05421858_2012 [Haladaptatus litoreus]|uniref:Uncharacterized protein n=1 Tax=Haladaptatus litoreus TaxID=553468 RepID=A0A1N6ZFU7_9EURY|nr:hypothetical protein [Haladaptatus litoreus]SIR25655.1 hypothetical protein SAMN05421858_2012 [Haladaptatus litoreus]